MTPKMKKCIEVIEKNLNVEYKGSTFQEAIDFISKYKEKSILHGRTSWYPSYYGEADEDDHDDAWYQVGRDDRW